MKKLIASTLVLLSIACVFAAGTALGRRQGGVHLVGKIGPPIIQPPPATPANPPLTAAQLANVLKLGNFKVTSVGGPAHFDPNHLYVNGGDFVIPVLANVDPRPGGSFLLQQIGGVTGTLFVNHIAKANTPFVVDFQVASAIPGQQSSVVTLAGPSSQTWNLSTPNHAVVVVYPNNNGLYNVVMNSKTGATLITGIDVTDVTN